MSGAIDRKEALPQLEADLEIWVRPPLGPTRSGPGATRRGPRGAKVGVAFLCNFWHGFWVPKGPLLDPFWGPKSAEDGPKTALEASFFQKRRFSRDRTQTNRISIFLTPRGAQNRPKRAPRGSERAPRGPGRSPRGPKKGPRGPREGPERAARGQTCSSKK